MSGPIQQGPTPSIAMPTGVTVPVTKGTTNVAFKLASMSTVEQAKQERDAVETDYDKMQEARLVRNEGLADSTEFPDPRNPSAIITYGELRIVMAQYYSRPITSDVPFSAINVDSVQASPGDTISMGILNAFRDKINNYINVVATKPSNHGAQNSAYSAMVQAYKDSPYLQQVLDPHLFGSWTGNVPIANSLPSAAAHQAQAPVVQSHILGVYGPLAANVTAVVNLGNRMRLTDNAIRNFQLVVYDQGTGEITTKSLVQVIGDRAANARFQNQLHEAHILDISQPNARSGKPQDQFFAQGVEGAQDVPTTAQGGGSITGVGALTFGNNGNTVSQRAIGDGLEQATRFLQNVVGADAGAAAGSDPAAIPGTQASVNKAQEQPSRLATVAAALAILSKTDSIQSKIGATAGTLGVGPDQTGAPPIGDLLEALFSDLEAAGTGEGDLSPETTAVLASLSDTQIQGLKEVAADPNARTAVSEVTSRDDLKALLDRQDGDLEALEELLDQALKTRRQRLLEGVRPEVTPVSEFLTASGADRALIEAAQLQAGLVLSDAVARSAQNADRVGSVTPTAPDGDLKLNAASREAIARSILDDVRAADQGQGNSRLEQAARVLIAQNPGLSVSTDVVKGAIVLLLQEVSLQIASAINNAAALDAERAAQLVKDEIRSGRDGQTVDLFEVNRSRTEDAIAEVSINISVESKIVNDKLRDLGLDKVVESFDFVSKPWTSMNDYLTNVIIAPAKSLVKAHSIYNQDANSKVPYPA